MPISGNLWEGCWRRWQPCGLSGGMTTLPWVSRRTKEEVAVSRLFDQVSRRPRALIKASNAISFVRSAMLVERLTVGLRAGPTLFTNAKRLSQVDLQQPFMPSESLSGERGIRTPGTVTRTHAFQACSFSHSDISPAHCCASIEATLCRSATIS